MARFCLLAAVLLLFALPAAAKPTVSDVRIGQHPDKTRFVLELDEAPAYRVFSLPDPYRVVIDLPELDWTPVSQSLPAGTGLVSGLRYGLFTPGTSRVVLDVTAPVALAEVFLLTPRGGHGHRLVIDLARIDRASFLQDAHRRPVESPAALPGAAAALPAPAPAKPTDGRHTVVIDAGHGGVDPGAIGLSGTYEKDLVLAYARALRDGLRASGRYRVVLTRDDDRFIPLRDRIAAAQRAGGELFISLHANTHPSGRIRGAAVYTLSETASDSEAEALAARENKVDIIAGIDLSNQSELVSQILIDLAQRETMNFSKSFASVLVDELGKRSKLLRNTHRFAGFAVLKSPTVPSVLVEIGYMSHRGEEKLLLSSKHRERVTKALVAAINRYFEVQQALRR